MFPLHPFTLTGGCSCGAIRYKVEVPSFEKRPLYLGIDSARQNDPDAPHWPVVAHCSCNDCRQSTAGLFLGAVCCPADMVMVSCLSRECEAVKRQQAEPLDGKTFPENSPAKPREAIGKLCERDDPNANRPPYRPGLEMLLPSAASEDTFVGFYRSSARRTRMFCQRCGTPIAYNVYPMPAPFPEIFDVIIGNLDRECLDGLGGFDVQGWWNMGIPWVQELTKGLDIPKHTLGLTSELVKE